MGLEVAALAVTAIGAGVAAYSSYQQGQAQAQASNYQSAVAANNSALAQNNANLARRDAALTEAQAASEQSIAIRRSRAMIGSQVASTAARGVLVDEGSALDIRSGTAAIADEEAQRIQQTGARRGQRLFAVFRHDPNGRVFLRRPGGELSPWPAPLPLSHPRLRRPALSAAHSPAPT